MALSFFPSAVSFKLAVSILTLDILSVAASLCRTSCGAVTVSYPFGIDDGCGAPQLRRALSCNDTVLFFETPSGSYKVQSIDYEKQSVLMYDPLMSTCSILQPHHDFIMTDVQYAVIPPSDDTVFAILNCSIDSPVLNHYKYLCFDNVGGHSCDELYGACNSFRLFHAAGAGTNTSPPINVLPETNLSSPVSNSPPATSILPRPPCCFTRYSTVKFMSMNMLDCTHYTTVVGGDKLSGVGPLDWVYGIRLTYAVPDSGCSRCKRSGGTCGFDADSEAALCLCSGTVNATRECGK